MNIQTLLIENSNRGLVQAEIREAFIKGAQLAGFEVDFYDDDRVDYCETDYDDRDDAYQAGIDYVLENVDLD